MTESSFDPGLLADVEIHSEAGSWTLVFTRNFRHTPEKLWQALTRPDELAQWAPFTADRDLSSTGKATLTMTDRAETTPSTIEVTRAEPNRVLEYSWDDQLLRWELKPIPTGTRLTLSHTVPERDMAPMMAAGWHLCLLVADRRLAGNPIARIVGDDAYRFGWQDLHDRYAAEL